MRRGVVDLKGYFLTWVWSFWKLRTHNKIKRMVVKTWESVSVDVRHG